MIFSKKLKKTAACILAGVMMLALSTGALADSLEAGDLTVTSEVYHNVTVNYTVTNAAGGQISIIALAGDEVAESSGTITYDQNQDGTTDYTSPNNILWIDQQEIPAADDQGVSTGSFTFKVDATLAADGFYVKSGYTGADGVIYDYVTIASQGGSEDDGDDDPIIEDNDIAIVPDVATNPFGVTGGKVVKMTSANLDKNKNYVIAGGEGEDDVEVFYTEYDLGDGNGVVVKFVTLIDRDFTAADLKETEGTAQKLEYGDSNGDTTINILDATDILGIMGNGALADSARKMLASDTNGDGIINILDATDILGIMGDDSLVPQAAHK